MDNRRQTSTGCGKTGGQDDMGFTEISRVEKKLYELFHELFAHKGYGQLEVFMRILKRGQKEIVLRMGKEFRFVVDYRKETSPMGKKYQQQQGGRAYEKII